MNKETVAMAASSTASVAGSLNSWWLWVKADPSAHLVTMLTLALIASQLYWGWRKFFRGEQA